MQDECAFKNARDLTRCRDNLNVVNGITVTHGRSDSVRPRGRDRAARDDKATVFSRQFIVDR